MATPKVKTYKLEIKVKGEVRNTIVDTRLELFADVYGLNLEEVEWALEEHGRCDTVSELGRDITITEVE